MILHHDSVCNSAQLYSQVSVACVDSAYQKLLLEVSTADHQPTHVDHAHPCNMLEACQHIGATGITTLCSFGSACCIAERSMAKLDFIIAAKVTMVF